MKRTRWRIAEVYKAIVLSQKVWRCLNHADWCAKVMLPPEEALKWHREGQEAISDLEKMGLADLVEQIIKMRR